MMSEFSTTLANNLGPIVAGAVEADVILPNPQRVAIYLVNTGAVDVTLHFGDLGTVTAGQGLVLPPDGTYYNDTLGVDFVGKIRCITGGGAGSISGVEMISSMP